MGFPPSWKLPQELPLRTQWRLIGNSINVAVVSCLIQRVLLWQGRFDSVASKKRSDLPLRESGSRAEGDVGC